MVSFVSRVQYAQDDQITGVEVTVFNESGDNIGEISITNADTLNEMREALDVIDETYFTQDRLLNLLANSDEELLINATRLNGLQSDAFANTIHNHSINNITNLQSSLNLKSDINHPHSITDITDLFSYKITCDKNNVNVGEEITIGVIVKDASNRPVANVPVEIIVNNSTVLSGSTNSSGTYSTTYTPNTGGLHRFSVKNHSEFVNVKSAPESTIQKANVITGKCDVYYNPDLKLCQVIVTGDFSISGTGSLGTNVLSRFKPKTTIPMAVFTTGLKISINDSNGNIYYVNNSGSNGNKTVVASATYFYK